MKVLLLLVVSCFALHNGHGAPTTAVYKLVKCNPKDGQANCVTHQSAEMEWSPDLPGKLSAAEAQHLETTAVEDEHPDREGTDEKDTSESEQTMSSDEGESPSYEGGSGDEMYISWNSDESFSKTMTETGSGEEDMDLNKGEDKSYTGHVYRRSLREEENQWSRR
ncbi:hypothetical protein Q5P01_006818 [Channa striata]|uniref:Uncharacterized protein n=1 Tax=Channa striata TaxID=64152 RepID=A0AA88N9I7_CHASR|nr:hypothetical protein Q5P01_006818 [Channa striata]